MAKEIKMKKLHKVHWRICTRLLGSMLVISVLALGLLHITAFAVSESGAISVAARVPGPPPSAPSSIDTPTTGATFSAIPIVISGTCPQDGLVIKIIDNGSFVGSTICKNGGAFTVSVDLLSGKNNIIAQEFDALDQQGPDSEAIIVFYNPPAAPVAAGNPTSLTQQPSSSQQSISQLIIQLDSQFSGYTGYNPGQQLSFPLRVSGGSPPYAVHIDWDDGSESLASLSSGAEPLVAAHTYNQAGGYQITVTASDTGGQKAMLSIALIINGKAKSANPGASGTNGSTWHLIWLYPFFGISLLLAGFGLGRIVRQPKSKQAKKDNPPQPS